VAVLDPSRTAVELSDDELNAAAALLSGDGEGVSDTAALAALEEAGVVRNGAILPYVGRFLTVVASPKLRIVIERFIAQRVVVDNVWAVEQLAVWGSEVRGGGIELRPVEPALLPWEIMRAVGLGPRAHPPIDTRLCVPAATLEGVEQHLIAGDREAADALLRRTTEFDEATRGVVIEMVRLRRSSWRASSIWTDDDGPRAESITVVDSGDGGLWISTATEGADESTLCLEPVLPSTVLGRIVGLVPGAPAAPDDIPAFDD
jgi:hypothetical protein